MRSAAALLALCALAAVAGRADDPEPPAKDADLKALQGTWKVTSATGGGKPAGDVAKLVVAFGKGKLTAKHGDREKARESTFTLDPKKDPKQIDITHDGRTQPGIYKIEKGTLYLSLSGVGKK